MKQYICGFTADRIESSEHFYAIYSAEQYLEYKKFFNETCKTINEDEAFEVDPGYDNAEISLYWIRKSLDDAIEMTEDISKALHLLRRILPSQEDILYEIKQYIEEEGYLED